MNSVLFKQRDALGLITLNRPEALNALTTAMAEAMLAQLLAWREDASIEAVIVKSAGGKAFCAGGDIRAIVEGSKEDAIRFFTAEYRLNHLIHHYPKPTIALMDGIVMGGGVGISIHASHRIATENTLWAMPETAIGFYPDIGATYFLSRLPGEIGAYLALTGARLQAPDLRALGLATGFVPSTDLNNIVPSSRGLTTGSMPAASWIPRLNRGMTEENYAVIEKCFAFDTVEEIAAALKEENGTFAGETLATFSRMSPTSLKVSLRQLRRGRAMSFDAALQSEFALTTAFLGAPDFREGVRAMIIDKDKSPRWQPPTLGAVTEEMVERFFAVRPPPLSW